MARLGIGAASLLWILYSLVTWLAPGALCVVGHRDYCAEASHQALGAKPVDGARAFRLATRGCGLGNAMSCNNLGVCYQRGAGTEKNVPRADLYYRRACQLGAGIGCYNVGKLLEDAGRVEEARAQFDLSCTTGMGEGCGLAPCDIGPSRPWP